MLGLERGTVRLEPHDRTWQEEGAKAVADISSIFGKKALGCEHVGSTSIRQIPAKPILDIAVAVSSLSDALSVVSSMEDAGYTHVSENDEEPGDNGYGGQIFFSLRSFDGKSVTQHIHAVVHGSREWEDYIAFRTYLNGRPDIARAYGNLKTELAIQYPNDRKSYTEGKAQWISDILVYARHWRWLGETVTVTVDRPVGSRHPNRPDIIYPINCGLPKDLSFPDEKRLGVYVLGINHPVHVFTGRVIAIICRKNGEGTRWVVAPEGKAFDQAQIFSAVWFRERDFQSNMEFLFHRSVGMVIYRYTASGYRFLLLRECRSLGWSIPKGHMEHGESEIDTAIREVREETGLTCTPIPGFRREVNYPIPPIYHKTLVSFVASTDENPKIQPEEISEYKWVSLSEAERLLKGRRFSDLIRAASVFLKENNIH